MRALHRVLLDQAVREKFKQRGYEQVKKFSWETSARQIIAVYEAVAGKQEKDRHYAKAM
jgi:glycosyltransferase involved in cell wall biosynthesis